MSLKLINKTLKEKGLEPTALDILLENEKNWV